MSGATQMTVAFAVDIPFTFNGGTITGVLSGGFGNRTVTFIPTTISGNTSYNSGFSTLSAIIPPGIYTGVTLTLTGGLTPVPASDQHVSENTLMQFRGPPVTSAFVGGFNGIGGGAYRTTFNIKIA